MNSLSMPAEIYEALVDAGRAALPLEACGLLAGTGEVITKFYPLTNADQSAIHFTMLPEEQFAAIKDMRARGIVTLGIWHSHPHTPARMSEEDIRLALTPNVSYPILSLQDKDKPVLKAFKVVDDIAIEIPLTITTGLRSGQLQPELQKTNQP